MAKIVEYYDEHRCLTWYEELDEKGRIVYHYDNNGWQFLREYDSSYDNQIPSYVIESMNGVICYERSYDSVLYDAQHPEPYSI